MISPIGDIDSETERRVESLYETYKSVEAEDSDEFEPNWIATIIMGVFMVLIGLVISQGSVGLGVGFVVLGLIAIVGSYNVWKADTRQQTTQEEATDWDQIRTNIEVKQALQERQASRQEEIDEIVKAVKSTIRVRCTYCGTLNEESASKCESCGANL